MTWRERYLELLAQGEAAKHQGAALGRYIGQRMTPKQLRAMLADHYRATDARDARKSTERRQHNDR